MDRTDLYPGFPLGWHSKLCRLGNYSNSIDDSSGEQQWEILRAHQGKKKKNASTQAIPAQNEIKTRFSSSTSMFLCRNLCSLMFVGLFCKVTSSEVDIKTYILSFWSNIFCCRVGLDAAGPHQAQWWHISVQDSELQIFPLQIPKWSIVCCQQQVNYLIPCLILAFDSESKVSKEQAALLPH